MEDKRSACLEGLAVQAAQEGRDEKKIVVKKHDCRLTLLKIQARRILKINLGFIFFHKDSEFVYDLINTINVLKRMKRKCSISKII